MALGNYIDWMKACWFISITGNPAISVPCGFLPGAAAGPGLPTGLQIAGRHNADLSVLQLAHASNKLRSMAEACHPSCSLHWIAAVGYGSFTCPNQESSIRLS